MPEHQGNLEGEYDSNGFSWAIVFPLCSDFMGEKLLVAYLEIKCIDTENGNIKQSQGRLSSSGTFIVVLTQ